MSLSLRLLPLFVFLGLAAVLLAGVLRNQQMQKAGVDPRSLPSTLIDKPAPDFSLPELHDPSVQISRDGLLGQAYLLNVWGSWCFACRIEHDLITELATNGPVPVYGLNWRDQRSEAQRWLAQFGDPYRASAYDESGRVGIDFGVYGAPETFLIDAEGRVRYKYVGPLNDEVVKQELMPIIEEITRR